MRIGKFLASLPTLALGLLCWRYAEWAGTEENWNGDGACQFLDECFYYLLTLFFFFLTALILPKRNLFLDVFRWIEAYEKAREPLHPSEGTTSLFD